MPDTPGITDILGLGKVGATAIEVTAKFLERIFGPPADALGGAISDPIERWRKKRNDRAIETLTEAAELLSSANREPRAVPGRILFPILEHSSLEDDDDLRHRWARLLSRAADPEHGREILPSFPSILAELTPVEVRY